MQHGRFMLCLLLAVLVLSFAAGGPALAKDEPGQAHDPHKKAGEPPIFTPVRIDLAIWTLVVFLLLLFILSKYAWNPLLGGLQKREESIRAALDEAQKAREESQRLRADFDKEIKKAHENARAILDEARKDAERSTQEMLVKARSEIQAERDRLRREIQTAQDQALQEIWTQSANLATLISHKVIRRELNAADHHRLVDEALKELGQANVGWKDRNIF